MKQQHKKPQDIKGVNVIASSFCQSSTVNGGRTDSKYGTPLTQPRSGPVLYDLIDKDGHGIVTRFTSAQAAADYAAKLWPDQEQDEDRTGKGWDIAVVGAER